jgi:hypothetical protein
MNPTESPYRVPTRALWIVVIVCLMAVLISCGGGGGGGGGTGIAGVGSGGTGASFSGPITGFGSIIVNGVRIDDSSASITLDDDKFGGSNGDLKLGMMVDVEGEKDGGGATGKASSISTRSLLQGPVSAIDTSGNRLTVLGVTVTVTSRTVFDGPGVTGLDALKRNDAVEVHGIPDQSGGVKATRIERMSPTKEIRLTGIVQQGAGASTFVINGFIVQYQPADLADMPNGISAGMLVRVKGTLSGNTIDAGSVRLVRLSPPVKNSQHVEIEGVVTRYTSASEFEVNGMPVRLGTGAKTEGSVALGEHVEIEGRTDNDVVVATKVEVEDDRQGEKEDAFELHGPIASVDLAAGTFTMRKGSVIVKWDAATRFDSDKATTDSRLTAGENVKIKGKMRGNVLLATQVEEDD